MDIDPFSYSVSTKDGVNMSMAYGFFEIDFYEGNKNYYYTINYTVYDGVIIRNDLNGEIGLKMIDSKELFISCL